MEHPIHIDRSLKDKIDRTLEPGEKIQWMEKPAPFFFTHKTKPVFVLGIPFTGFALFRMYGPSGFELPDFNQGFDTGSFFSIMGLLCLIIGLGMLMSPLWAWFTSLKTVYLITNRRALIIQGGGSSDVHSYPPDQLRNIYHRNAKNQKGDVIFHVRTWEGLYGRTQAEEIGFLRVDNPLKVKDMLANLNK